MSNYGMTATLAAVLLGLSGSLKLSTSVLTVAGTVMLSAT
mgnify:CR=1 FL=1